MNNCLHECDCEKFVCMRHEWAGCELTGQERNPADWWAWCCEQLWPASSFRHCIRTNKRMIIGDQRLWERCCFCLAWLPSHREYHPTTAKQENRLQPANNLKNKNLTSLIRWGGTKARIWSRWFWHTSRTIPKLSKYLQKRRVIFEKQSQGTHYLHDWADCSINYNYTRLLTLPGHRCRYPLWKSPARWRWSCGSIWGWRCRCRIWE